MRKYQRSDATYLLGFFAVVIGIGSALLSLPVSWSGSGLAAGPLRYIDALFTATSAVCVTGLAAVDTAEYSRFGQTVILLLIQVGGLGIISFTSLLLTIPGRRLPLRRLKTIQSFYVEGVEYEPKKIVRSIIFFTFGIEAAGAVILYFLFAGAGVDDAAFVAVFHSVSAFCNAGFSVFSSSLEGYSGNLPLMATIAVLVVMGGVGFIVIQDIERRLRGKRRRLSYHTKVVLGMTATLIFSGALAFFLLERGRAYESFPWPVAMANAFFQSITTRTAGFDTVVQATLSQPSKALTLLLMFIGGSPGSIAGGIKVTTAFVVAAVMLRRPDSHGDITVFKRRLSARTMNDAVVYFLKATFLLAVSAGALSLIEGLRGVDFSVLLFETVSAFGTVGLSLGMTGSLSDAGKLVIIATMFAGRVGLIALAFPALRRYEAEIVYPEGSILLG